MTNRKMDLECLIRPQDLKGLRPFYEIYPTPVENAEDIREGWFEIVLHIEVEERWSPDHPESRRIFSILMSLADLLIQRVAPYAPYDLEMPASYYTVHPSASDPAAAPTLARSISLVFLEISPDKLHDGLDILARLKAELALLEVPHLRKASVGGCR